MKVRMQCELGERFRAGWRVNWDAKRQLQISIRLVTCRICSSQRGLYNLTIVANVVFQFTRKILTDRFHQFNLNTLAFLIWVLQTW